MSEIPNGTLPPTEGGRGYKPLPQEIKSALKVWFELVAPNANNETGRDREVVLYAYGELFANYLKAMDESTPELPKIDGVTLEPHVIFEANWQKSGDENGVWVYKGSEKPEDQDE